jgi:hypothetical protein
MPKPYCELRSQFIRTGITQKEAAEKIHCHEATFSNKMMGHIPFNLVEAYILCRLLDIPEKDLPRFFPYKEVEKLIKKAS